MPVKTIKDVDEKTWRRLKMLSAEHNTTMGNLLRKIAEDYESKNKEFWHEILHGEKMLSDEEAEDMKRHVRKLRKEYGFR